jgi:hypothetical protein
VKGTDGRGGREGGREGGEKEGPTMVEELGERGLETGKGRGKRINTTKVDKHFELEAPHHLGSC